MTMADWLTMRGVPCDHDARKLYHGARIDTDEAGETITVWAKPKPFKGSHDKQITIRTDPRLPPLGSGEDTRSFLEISGNPSKFFQAHNLFGSNDVLWLAKRMIYEVIRRFGFTPKPEKIIAIECGNFFLSRVDLTESWALGSRAEVRAAIRTLERGGTMRNRGRGLMKGGTVYWGKHSRRWSLKVYGKADEIEVESKKFGDHRIPEKHHQYEQLKAHAENIIRFEFCFRGKELKEHALRLDKAANWGEGTADKVYQEYFRKLEIADQVILPADDVSSLPKRLQTAYQLWVDGHDLRSFLLKATFYRYRKQLREIGIDISNPIPDLENAHKHIICLKTLLQSPPVPVPVWAVGKGSYFEPKATLGAEGAGLEQMVTRWQDLLTRWQETAHVTCVAA